MSNLAEEGKDYIGDSEFIMSVMNDDRLSDSSAIKFIFERFDVMKTGVITVDEIKNVILLFIKNKEN
jgi:hypothetical protein